MIHNYTVRADNKFTTGGASSHLQFGPFSTSLSVGSDWPLTGRLMGCVFLAASVAYNGDWHLEDAPARARQHPAAPESHQVAANSNQWPI